MSKLTINGKDLEYPIVQGGMGIGISLHKLSVTSMDNGVAGTISAAQNSYKNFNEVSAENNLSKNLEALEGEIQKARTLNKNGILGVNLMHAAVDYQEYMKFLFKQDIDFIISGAGLPLDMPKNIGNSNVKLAVIVSSGKAAKIICKR